MNLTATRLKLKFHLSAAAAGFLSTFVRNRSRDESAYFNDITLDPDDEH